MGMYTFNYYINAIKNLFSKKENVDIFENAANSEDINESCFQEPPPDDHFWDSGL